MTLAQYNFIAEIFQGIFADRPTQSVTDWCCENLYFDEPDNHGPFNVLGAEYMRAWLDEVADPLIYRSTFVCGTQTRKTGAIMGRTCWLLVHEGCRVFWVMPSQDLVRKFSSSRWMPFVRASPLLASRIPTGADRHEFSKLQQRIGSGIVDFAWAGSPSALSSTPARVVNLDEEDKFNEATDREANSVSLAEQRTKSFSNPKITDTSTPTVLEGPVWENYLKSDQKRRYMPCPECKTMVVLAWSKDYTVFPICGNEAFAEWDKESRRNNGSWDLDRVERSARYLCPKCGFHIQDRHKTWMDRSGVWRPQETRCKRLTERGWEEVSPIRGHSGYHLPSFYSPSAQRNVGKLAIKFLQESGSLAGPQDLINSEFAEPYFSQNSRNERVEIIVKESEVKTGEGVQILVADVQEKAPHFWYVRQLWEPGSTTVLEFGSCMTAEELRQVQLEHKIPDNHVGIDSGDQTEAVYELCTRYGTITPQRHGAPLHVGWIPLKGFKTNGWNSPKLKIKTLTHLQPLDRRINGRVICLPLLEIADGPLKDILKRMRQGKTQAMLWKVAESANTEQFWEQLDAEKKARTYNKKTGFPEENWIKKSKYQPNEAIDCCKGEIAMALFLKILVDTAVKEA